MKGAKGWTLIFHEDLISKSELGKTISNYNFFSYDINEALHLSDDEKETLNELVKKIQKEYSQNIDKHSQTLIISNIELLLNYCNLFYDRQFYTRTNLNKDYISEFESLLDRYYKTERHLETGIPSVSYFGEEMNMSAHYLSDLLKKETGKSASEHIQLYVINRAKNELLTSNNPINQIAYGLGFEYPQHFSKLFKKKTGMTPKEFRNLN